MDEWVKTVIGGLIGGGIASLISWFKYRDERRDLLREAHLALFTAVERLRTSTIYIELRNLARMPDRNGQRKGGVDRLHALRGDIMAATIRVEFLESSEACLARVNALTEAVREFHSAGTNRMNEDENSKDAGEAAQDAAADNLRSAEQELLREAKLSVARM